MSKTTGKALKGAGGNTKTPAEKEVRSLFFTYNNPKKAEKAELEAWFKGRKNMSYIFQEETGENGTPHLQGVFKSSSSIKFSTLKKLFPRIHWEKTKNWKDAVKYCSKEETRTGKIYKSDDIKITVKRKIKDPLEGKELYGYQEKVLNILKKEPDERKVYWFWEENGGVGKSALVKHIYLKNTDRMIIATGKGNDVRNQINYHINGNEKLKLEPKELDIAILDISRTVEDYVSYEVIEQIKNGLLYSGKYEGGMCAFNSPHVIIFANFEPKYDALSSDRWRVYNIDEDGNAVRTVQSD